MHLNRRDRENEAAKKGELAYGSNKPKENVAAGGQPAETVTSDKKFDVNPGVQRTCSCGGILTPISETMAHCAYCNKDVPRVP